MLEICQVPSVAHHWSLVRMCFNFLPISHCVSDGLVHRSDVCPIAKCWPLAIGVFVSFPCQLIFNSDRFRMAQIVGPLQSVDHHWSLVRACLIFLPIVFCTSGRLAHGPDCWSTEKRYQPLVMGAFMVHFFLIGLCISD